MIHLASQCFSAVQCFICGFPEIANSSMLTRIVCMQSFSLELVRLLRFIEISKNLEISS